MPDQRFYSVKPKAAANAQAAEVFIYGDIGDVAWDESTVAAADFVRDFGAIDAEEITIRINSFGGSVVDGIAIYNAIKRHPAKVHTEIDGIAYSIASMIAMAGDTRGIAENGRLMIHAPWTIGMGNARDLREAADDLDQYASMMSSAYVNASGKPQDEVLALLTDGENHYYNATESQAAGFVTEITAALPVAASAHKHFDLSRYQRGEKHAAAAAKPEEQDMPQENPTPAAEPQAAQQPSADDIKAAALREEKQRRGAVAAAFNQFKEHDFGDLKAQCLDDTECTADKAREKILAKLAAGVEPLQKPRIDIAHDSGAEFKAAAVNAVLARAGIKTDDGDNEMRAFGFHDFARRALAVAGTRTDGMGKEQIIQAALSTSDFPMIFENAMHKTLVSAYNDVPVIWDQICDVTDLADFRPHNRYRMGSFGRLKKMGEGGEIQNITLPDAEREQLSADENGLIFELTYRMLVDDDMGAFLRIAQGLGRSAALSVEEDFFTLLTGNPTMSDGVAMFHADHDNLAGTGSAVSVSSLGAARQAMRKQKDPGGNSYIAVNPEILLTPLAVEDTAWQVINSPTDPSKTNSRTANRENNRWTLLSSPYMDEVSATEWYALARPGISPAFSVGFVGGRRTPEVTTEDNFRTRGIAYRVTHDYGVGADDYRTAYKNPGS